MDAKTIMKIKPTLNQFLSQFDDCFGRSVPFLRDLDQTGQNYVAEIPQDTRVRTARPQVLYKAHRRDQRRGRQKQYPRLKVKNNPPAQVRHILNHSPRLRQKKWQTYHVKDGTKGPMVWEVKRLTVWQEDENGLPTPPSQLVIARNVLNPDEIKYFLSNAPESTPTEILLRVAFTRWTVERAFEDSKTELGMAHFEVRQYQSIQRHLILCCLSHLFLSEFCLNHRGEKTRPDGLPGTDSSGPIGPAVDCRTALFPEICPGHQRRDGRHAATKCQGPAIPLSPNDPEITRCRYLAQRHNSLSLESLVAL